MITLEDFTKAIQFKISGGSDFTWTCFGPNARYLDSNDDEGSNGTYSVSAIFDSVTQTVYSVEAWDYVNDREYRWLNPEFKIVFEKESAERGANPEHSLEGRKYIDLEVAEDILEKIQAIVTGEEYDTRVKVPVDFTDEELLKYMKMAHDMDITFNQLVERAIQNAITEYKSDPESYKKKAKRFFNET